LSREQRERERQAEIYSKGESITPGDRCWASLPGLDLLLGMGAGGGPWGLQAIGPNPVPTNILPKSSTVYNTGLFCEERKTVQTEITCLSGQLPLRKLSK